MEKKIKAVYAFSVLNPDGTEDVMGVKMSDSWMPLLITDEKIMEKAKATALAIAKENKLKVTLSKFTHRKDIEVLG